MYNNYVLQQFELLDNQTATIELTMTKTIAKFIELAGSFNEIVNGTIEYRDLVDAIYIGFIDLNVSNPMFNGTFYDDVTEDTLPEKQGIALQFVQESNAGWEFVAEMFRARLVFYESVNFEFNLSKPLDQMYEQITVGMTAFASEGQVRNIGEEVNAHSLPM